MLLSLQNLEQLHTQLTKIGKGSENLDKKQFVEMLR